MSSAFSTRNILIRKSLCIYTVIDLGPIHTSSKYEQEGTELREINIACSNTKQKDIFKHYYLRYGILCEKRFSFLEYVAKQTAELPRHPGPATNSNPELRLRATPGRTTYWSVLGAPLDIFTVHISLDPKPHIVALKYRRQLNKCDTITITSLSNSINTNELNYTYYILGYKKVNEI